MSLLFGGGGGSKKTAKTSIVSTVSPRIGSYTIQTSTEGIAIPLIYGMIKAPGNLIWAGNFQAIPHTTVTTSGGGSGARGGKSGGKGGGGKAGGGGGGGGGTVQYDTTYTYTMAVLLGLCLGVIQGINQVWAEKSSGALSSWFEGAMLGGKPQNIWGWLQTYYPTQALQYFGLAYAYSSAVDMGANASLPNFSFEVQGLLPFNSGAGIWDANPADILYDLLTNPYAGVGLNPALIAALTQYSNYCKANDLLLSPVYDSQQEAQQALTDLLQQTNSEAFFSEGVLKVVPYGDTAATGNGATFTPNLTPVYDLTEDDFKVQGSGNDPIILSRGTPADAYNSVPLEYLDRANNYDAAIQTASDLNAIKKYGLKIASAIQAHGITTAARANLVAQLILQKYLFVRNQYQFKLAWNFALLEPMDWVTLTDAKMGLNRLPVRIISIDEDQDGTLTMIGEEWPIGIAGSPLYGSQAKGGLEIDYNASPGSPNSPIIFEPPAQLTAVGYEIWIAASGGVLWGGAEVWVSVDNMKYVKAGVIAAPARTGILAALFPAGNDPDTTNSLQVDLTESRGTLLSGSQQDADLGNTLCYVDDEILSFQTATLTGANKYTLGTYLRRGIFGSGRLAHPLNSRFCRLDGAVFKYAFIPDYIGEIIYIKLLSYNIYQGGIQSLADVEPYEWAVGGTGMGAQMPDIQNLTTFYREGKLLLKWDEVDDALAGYRTVDYEVRRGATWGTGEILGRSKIAEFFTQGNGTYWVAAHNGNSFSANPAEVIVTNAVLVDNVIVTRDEFALGWPGTMSGGVFKDGNGDLQISGSTLGYYQIPDAAIVDVGTAQVCNLSFALASTAINPANLVDGWADWDAIPDVDGLCANAASTGIQVCFSQDGSTYGDWQELYPGKYVFRKVKWRLVLTVITPPATPLITGWAWTVDMPDRVDQGTNVALAAGGTSITYAFPFQSNPPNVQITILGATAGDDAIVTASTASGFTCQIKNGGSGVARNINWVAQGF